MQTCEPTEMGNANALRIQTTNSRDAIHHMALFRTAANKWRLGSAQERCITDPDGARLARTFKRKTRQGVSFRVPLDEPRYVQTTSGNPP